MARVGLQTHAMNDGGTDHYVTAKDGLRLHVREHGARTAPGLPVVCLAGLARTAADFDALAAALANDPGRPRRVLALDYRGRGLSDHDRNPANYSIPVELDDVLSVLTARAVGPAVFVGTSRGGLLAMLLGTVRPTVIAGCVLNDIGPVIEPAGVARIKGYVGKLPQPTSFENAAQTLRKLFGSQFPRLAEADWLAFARRTFTQAGGRLAPNYDMKLSTVLQSVDPEHPLAAMWKEFDSLVGLPVMVVHGENSDILSPATIEAMRARRSQLEVVEVAGEGHAPLLADAETIGRIAQFVQRCEEAV